MSRPIKFRAWLGSEMLRDELIVWTPDCELQGGTRLNTAIKKFQEEENFVLMQFTGLLDKSGTEIYEGDILQSEDTLRRWSVEYSTCLGGCYVCVGIGKTWSADNPAWEVLTVIGNIYEHPELVRERP